MNFDAQFLNWPPASHFLLANFCIFTEPTFTSQNQGVSTNDMMRHDICLQFMRMISARANPKFIWCDYNHLLFSSFSRRHSFSISILHSVIVSIYPFTWRSLHLHIYLFLPYLCVFRSNFQPIDLFIIISSYHCVSISTILFIYLSTYVCIYLHVCLSACLFI